MEQLLNEWKLSCLVETFKGNDIDLENVVDLTQDHLRELIPSVGLRLKFQKKLSEYCKEQVNATNASPVAPPVANSLASTAISTSTPIIIENPGTSSSIEGAASIINIEPTEQKKDTEIIIVASNSDVSATSYDDLFFQPVLPDFDLKTILSTNPLGLGILQYYKRSGSLDDTHRNRLSDIIIKHIFTYISQHRLRHEEYNVLTKKIVSLFPSEYPGTYYVPAVKKINSSTGRPILAKGKLVDKCRNLLHSCADVLPKKRKHDDVDDTSNDLRTLHNIDESVKRDIEWLKHRNEPWHDDVINKWNNTYECRRKSREASAHEFLQNWPILKDKRAYNLINLDFDKLYPNTDVNFIINWKQSFGLILQLKKKSVKDNVTLELISLLDDEALTDEKRFPLELSILLRLIPPKGRMKIGKNVWKFSIVESENAIICLAKVPGDIDNIIAENQKRAAANKIPVQPYIIVEGSSIVDTEKAYIVVDSLLYEFDSPITAFDICFKLFHVMDVNYPPQAEHIWLLIQKGIYKIDTKCDKTIPSILDILQKLITN